MSDPFETGTPKYASASSIYDALCEIVQTEEMGILSEMFADVSYDGQGYYYTDKGSALKEKFEELSEYTNKIWALDLAVWQIDQTEIHDLVYEALVNSDLAKRLGFKKLFIDKMLSGDKSDYDEITEEYIAELSELNRFDNWEMIKAFNRVMQARGKTMHVTPYPIFCYALIDKAKGLKLQEEIQLITECRALLTSYDDFMLGLRMNQVLHERLEQQYNAKVLQLQASYEEKVRQLFLIAEKQGVILAPIKDLRMLPENQRIDSAQHEEFASQDN
jgi:hypothetical protein